MVALNTDFAASKPDTDTKNRLGRFFSLAAETVGADRCSTQSNTREKQDCDYDLASSHCYGPFGELIRATGAKKDDFNFRFSTKYEDAETGLFYYGYRYYNAETGRWLNRDPIGEYGGLNLYGMVGNNSVNLIDILGNVGYSPYSSGHTTFGDASFFQNSNRRNDGSRYETSNSALDNYIGFWPGFVSGFRDFGFGLNNNFVIINLGVASMFGDEYSTQALIGIQNNRASFLKGMAYIAEDPKARITEFYEKTVGPVYNNLPDCVRHGLTIELGQKLGLHTTGRITGNVTLNLVSQAIIQKIATRINERLVAKFGPSRKFATSAAAGAAILGTQILGAINRAGYRSDELFLREPEIFESLSGNNLQYLDGFSGGLVDQVIQQRQNIKGLSDEELIKKYCCDK